jgi:hypothetical protein
VLGDIPGVPTVTGVFVLVICAQLLIGRNYFWLPNWLLDRSVSKGALRKAVRALRSPAKFVDRLLRPRLPFFAGPVGHYATAAVAVIVAVAMPAMEIVPFSANVAGAALTAFGLAVVAHDGLFGLFGFILAGATFGVIVLALL